MNLQFTQGTSKHCIAHNMHQLSSGEDTQPRLPSSYLLK